MTSERKDPREAVLFDEVDNFAAMLVGLWGRCRSILARLDAADPLRAILPEVVEALEQLVKRTPFIPSGNGISLSLSFEQMKELTQLLARLREIHPTTRGTDDG
jgi:hypothetical protein